MCSPSRSPLPPSSPPDRSLWLFPVHQVRALVSCIQPELVICFTLDNIHVSMLRQCIKKQRHYFVNNHTVKAMVFPVVMYECDSWTIMKSEHQRIDAFRMICWRRLLRVPWTAKRSNQSILKEPSPESSLEGLLLKLKF